MINENNFLYIENNTKIKAVSSQLVGCNAENILKSDIKTIWLSEEGLPQFIIIDMSQMIKRPKIFKYFAIYCWHAYPTNPKLFELLISKDNITYRSLGNFDMILKPGTQYFFIEEENFTDYNYLKMIIKETYGGNRAYLNNIFMFEDLNSSELEGCVSDSRERNMPRKSITTSSEKKNETDIKQSTERRRKYSIKSEIISYNCDENENDIETSYNKKFNKDNSRTKMMRYDNKLDNIYLISDSDLTSRRDIEDDNEDISKSRVFEKFKENNSRKKLKDSNSFKNKHLSNSTNEVKEKNTNRIEKSKSSKGNVNFVNIKSSNTQTQERLNSQNLDESEIKQNTKGEKPDSNTYGNYFHNSEINSDFEDMSISKVKHDNDAHLNRHDVSRISKSMRNDSKSVSSDNQDHIKYSENKHIKPLSNLPGNLKEIYSNPPNSNSNVNTKSNMNTNFILVNNHTNSNNDNHISEIIYKSLDDQIKDMQNQINKLTLESESREEANLDNIPIKDQVFSINNPNANTNLYPSADLNSSIKKNWGSQNFQNYDENNLYDIVNIKNSKSINYKIPNDVVSEMKKRGSEYYYDSSNLIEQNPKIVENDLQKYLNDDDDDDEIQRDISSESNRFHENYDKNEYYINNHENKINHIESKISTIENEINSMKLEMNRINKNIYNLLETKTLLNKNNMNHILDKCKKLINSNFNSESSKYNSQSHRRENGKNHPKSNDKNDFNKSERNFKKSYEKFVDAVIEKNFNSLLSRIQNKIMKTILKPTVKQLENNLKSNLNEVKVHLKYMERNKMLKSNKIKNSEEIKKYYNNIYRVIENLIQKLSKNEILITDIDKENSLNFNEDEIQIDNYDCPTRHDDSFSQKLI